LLSCMCFVVGGGMRQEYHSLSDIETWTVHFVCSCSWCCCVRFSRSYFKKPCNKIVRMVEAITLEEAKVFFQHQPVYAFSGGKIIATDSALFRMNLLWRPFLPWSIFIYSANMKWTCTLILSRGHQ
jgi:hypothetical protein